MSTTVRGVVFDYGKVICLPPEDSVIAELAALAGLGISTMESLVWRYREPYDRGEVNGVEYYRTTLAQCGIFLNDETIERMARLDLSSWTKLNDATVKLMEDVKAAGVKLGILSNMPRDFLEQARNHIPVFSLPDVGIFSCEIASVKPEAAIYHALITALGCEPWDIVFFDDLQVNVDAAVSHGIQAFLWKDAVSAREILKNLKALEV